MSPSPHGPAGAALPPSARSIVAETAAGVLRSGRDWTHLVDALEASARTVVAHAIPERGLKRFRLLGWFPYHGLARARRGTNCPVARIAVWFAGMRALGLTREEAQQVVDWLQDQVELLWPAEELDPVGLCILEQQHEGVESPLQAMYLSGDRTVRAQLIQALRAERSTQTSLIVALEAEALREGRAAA